MTGADAIVAALRRSEVEVVFGLPGVHALPLFDALRDAELRFVAGRTELSAGFAASGYARATGKATALLVSTGPGMLISLAAVLEAASSYDPVVVIASQIDSALIGRRRGALHEIPDQLGAIRPLVGWAERATSAEQLAALTAQAVAAARRAPTGPTYLEVPVDVLEADVAGPLPALDAQAPPPPCDEDALARCAAALDAAERPVLWLGGGAVRAGAFAELRALAERLDAPVVTTYMGKGAIDGTHPLAVGSACEERAVLDLLAGADVLLCVGTELGAETTGQWTLELPARTFQVDASPLRIGSTYATEPVLADARDALGRLAQAVQPAARDGAARAAAAREQLDRALDRGDRGARRLLRDLRAAVPTGTPTAFDMTILGYWAGSDWRADEGRGFLYPLGCGTLGYALPAAIGAAADGQPSLAVSGDGGAMYGLAELAVIAELELPVTWLVIDDGGYGVLRHYQQGTSGRPYAVDLARPEFAALARSFGLPAVDVEPGEVGGAVAAGLRSGAGGMVVCKTELEPPPNLS